MTTLRVRTGIDTYAGSAKPSEEHHKAKQIWVATGAAYGYLYIKNPAPRGALVQSALLYLTAKGASSGSRTETLKLITGNWKARTLNWTNKPAVNAASGTSTAIGALADAAQVVFDVTAHVQSWCDGAQNNGWRLESTGASHRYYSFDSARYTPLLVVTFTEAPSQPTNLRPGGGRVGVAQPTLQWEGTGDMSSYQVQADPAADPVAPDYDSTELSSTVSSHALAGTAFAQLDVDAATTYWRVRERDTGGQWSAWSDWAEVTRDNKGTLAIDVPAAEPGNVVWEPTPPILATLTGETLTAMQVLVTPASDRTKIRHDSSRHANTSGAYTLPAVGDDGQRLLVSGTLYSLGVRAWDAKKDRQGSTASGDEPYVEAWRDFTLDEDATVTAPALISAAQNGKSPAMVLTLTRAAAPDSFVLLRDGVEVASDILPADTFDSGTTYVVHDWTAPPGQTFDYNVRAVVNGRQSAKSNTVTGTLGTVEGTWVVDPDSDRYFVLAGLGVSDWNHVEVGTTYQALNARSGFRITQVLAGLAGSFNGLLHERDFRTVADMLADLWAMKAEAPHRDDFRLASDTMNIPVQVYALSSSVSEDSMDGYPRRNVSFQFHQTGEYEFEAHV